MKNARPWAISGKRSPHGALAFTLIELMVVVAIMGIVMAIAIPSIYRQLNPESMQKAVTDVMEACSHARARAILSGQPTELVIRPFQRTVQGPGFSTRLGETIVIELCDVNFIEYKDREEARVRFYPNGTSDEFTLVLHNDKDEWRKIWLEVVTALVDVETDPNKFLRR